MTNPSLGSITTFGEMLRYLRRRARLTQRELGQAVGYTDAHITRLENGQRLPPDTATLQGRFVEALGLKHDPAATERLMSLASAARDATYADEAVAVSAVRPIGPRLTNLPAALTHMIGREADIAVVRRLIAENRLVTLTGSGGVGKTRLAMEVGMASIASFADGAWCVEFGPVSDPLLVADTTAAALGLLPANRPARDLLVDTLCDKHLLLILDNCEHLIGACAQLATALLSACASLQVLATSRETMNITGEVLWRVPSLALDEAVLLFAERASAVMTGFRLSEGNRVAVSHICGRLDGIPLAIELAAARMRTFTVKQIETRLDERFQLLTGGSRTALPRHRSLKALVDWTYDLLPVAERALLRQLSVFAGSWTLHSAEAVYGQPVLDLLDQLANKSLIIVDTRGTETRYRMLETIRQYAHDRLEETGECVHTHQRHLAYCVQFVQEAEKHQHGPLQKIYRDRLEADIDNLRSAMAWAKQNGKTLDGLHLVQGPWWFWYRCGYVNEGLLWIEQLILSNDNANDLYCALGKAWSAWFLGLEGDDAKAYQQSSEALTLAWKLEDNYAITLAKCAKGFYCPDLPLGDVLLSEASRAAKELDFPWEEIVLKFVHGMYLLKYGELPRAHMLMMESLAGFERLQDATIAADSNMFLGHIMMMRGEYAQARAMFEDSIALGGTDGDVIGFSQAYNYLAATLVYLDDLAPATSAIRTGLMMHTRMGRRRSIAQSIGIAAAILWRRKQYQRSAQLFATAANAHDDWAEQWLVELRDRCLKEVREEMGEYSFAEAWSEGAKMTIKQAVDIVMAL